MNKGKSLLIFSLYFVSILAIILVMPILFSACSILQKPSDPTNPTTTNKPETLPPSQTPDVTSTPDKEPTSSPISPEEEAEKLLERLTLEEKVGQLFFVASRYNTAGEKQLGVDEALAGMMNKFKPGGFIFFAENLESIPQTEAFINDLQRSSDIPLFIGIDEEGGIVTRLNKAEKLHSTIMPDPFTIGKTNDPEYALKVSKAVAEEIKSLGFNMNFAPVADVFSNPDNKIIGKRAYSSDAVLASKMVTEAVKGAYEGGIIPALKHFPGHGDTLQDSHTGAAIVENDLDRLRKLEFLPFKAGLKAGAEVVMTAHVLTPEITQNGLPATLSKPILQGILRDELGFDGLIITDGLEMSAISAFYPEEEAVVLAIEAGVDMLLLPKDFEAAYHAVLSAVKEGRLTEQRINESVLRILKLKTRHILNKPDNHLNPDEVLGSQQHRKLAEEIKEKSTKQ